MKCQTPKERFAMPRPRQFENDDAAIEHARQLAAKLATADFGRGTVIVVTDEQGNLVAKVPVRRLDS